MNDESEHMRQFFAQAYLYEPEYRSKLAKARISFVSTLRNSEMQLDSAKRRPPCVFIG